MKTLLNLMLFFCCSAVFSQVKQDLFEHYTLSDAALKDFTIHVTKSDSAEPLPVLLYLDGSGSFPLFYKTKKGTSTAVPLDVRKYSKEYRVVLISKPGIPFSDSLKIDDSGRKYYPEPDSYKKLYSLDWRANTASKAIDYVLKNIPVNKQKIIVMGYSEGAQVAPRVAVINKKVTHVVCFGGNALNQLYDFILKARLEAEKGIVSATEAQQTVDSLYSEYEKIYADPKSTEKEWYGEAYLKWSSFTQTTPLENMLQLNIPILYVAGGRDNNQTILDMDYARLEFIRKGKKNLTYKVYPECNHYFQQTTTTPQGTSATTDRIDEVHQFAVDWVKAVK